MPWVMKPWPGDAVYAITDSALKRLRLALDNRRILERMPFRPTRDLVLIDPIEDEAQIGSILVPDMAREKARLGRVVSVGAGHRDPQSRDFIPTEVKPGDLVLMTEFRGQPFVYEGKDMWVMSERDVLAVVEGDVPHVTSTPFEAR